MSSINDSSIEHEAKRLLSAEREAKRRAALEKQRSQLREMAEMAAKERDARIALEAERIEAQRKAEEAIIAAKVRAEKEAYDAAVAKKLEELRARPEVEILRAELEELREELRGEYNSMRQATPWTAPLQEVRAQISSCPWNGGIQQLQKQVADLQSSLIEFKVYHKKPARQISVWFSSGMTITGFNNTNTGQVALQGQNPVLTIQYYMVPLNVYGTQGAQHTLTVQENTGQAIQVQEGQKVFVASARAATPNNSWSRDMTHLYKSLLETQ